MQPPLGKGAARVGPSIQECHNSATHVFGSARSVNGPRRQRQAAHLHSLGPRPTLEAFLEVADGRDLDDVLGRYARLAANLSGSGQAEAARNLSGQNAGVAAHRLARRFIVDGT